MAPETESAAIADGCPDAHYGTTTGNRNEEGPGLISPVLDTILLLTVVSEFKKAS